MFVARDGITLLNLPDGSGGNLLLVDPVTGEVGFIVGAPITDSLPEANILVGNASGNAEAVAVSGDLTLVASGEFQIASGVVVNADINATAGIARTKLAAASADTVAVFDGNGFLVSSAITPTKLGYLTDVTGNIQAQLDAKQATITGGATTIASANLTADLVLASNSSGKVVVTSTPVSKIALIDNLTSDAQTQLDSKLTVNVPSPVTGDMLYFDGSYWTSIGIGGVGEVITSNGSTPEWAAGTSNGLPSGGSANEVLRKIDGSDYNVEWHLPEWSDISDIVGTTADEINALAGITVGATELNALTGIGGNVQAQLNSKLSNILPQNALYVGSSGNIPGYLSPGANASILTIVAGVPTWAPLNDFGNFTGLGDVPHDYTGFGGYTVRVKMSEDGLEFAAGGGGGSVNDANNGLDLSADVAQLGGLLIKNTTIDGDGMYDLTITDVDALSLDAANVLIMSTGEIDLVANEILINGSAGTDGQLVRSTGSGTAPVWQTVDLGYVLNVNNDASTKQIKNVVDATDPQDVTTLSQVAGLISSAATPSWSDTVAGKVERSTTGESQNVVTRTAAGSSDSSNSDGRTPSEKGLVEMLLSFISTAWTWTLTQTFTAGTIHSNVTASMGAFFDGSKRLISATVSDFLDWLGINPDLVSVSESSGKVTLNMNSSRSRRFNTSATASSGFEIELSNTGNAGKFTYFRAITGTVAITCPSNFRMDNDEVDISGRWNSSTRVLTVVGVTDSPFEFSGEFDGSVWLFRASNMYV